MTHWIIRFFTEWKASPKDPNCSCVMASHPMDEVICAYCAELFDIPEYPLH